MPTSHPNRNRVTLKPAPGRIVKFPPGGPHARRLKPEGEELTLTTYWRRRLNAGDVVEVKAAGKTSVKKEG